MAVTSREECQLFPTEGAWALFFCFLEFDKEVKLRVSDPSSLHTISNNICDISISLLGIHAQ